MVGGRGGEDAARDGFRDLRGAVQDTGRGARGNSLRVARPREAWAPCEGRHNGANGVLLPRMPCRGMWIFGSDRAHEFAGSRRGG
jgi:hypothetical protein